MQSTQGMNVMNRIGTVYQLCCILIQQRQMQAVTQSFTNDEMDKVNRHSITCRESVCAFFFLSSFTKFRNCYVLREFLFT